MLVINDYEEMKQVQFYEKCTFLTFNFYKVFSGIDF